MTELLTPHGIKETIGFILKLAFCIAFYFGTSDKLGTGIAITPIIVLTLLTVYWKFVRHRFDKQDKSKHLTAKHSESPSNPTAGELEE